MNEDIAHIYYEFRDTVMPKVHESIRQLKAEYPQDVQRQARTEHLKTRMEGVVYRTLCKMADYDETERTGNIDSRLFLGEQVLGGIKTIIALQKEIFYLKSPGPKNGKGRAITDDMIERARQFPMDQLVEINRNRMAVCPFHGDKDPSFSIKNNFGYCFGCGWHGNAIDFVMEKEGVRFADAVKRLQ